MNRQSAHEKKDSLRLFYFFCIIVSLLIFGSLILKAFQTIRASSYDPGHSFVLTFLTQDGAVVYPINPDEKEFSAVRINSDVKNFNVARDLHIPQSAVVRENSSSINTIQLKSQLSKLFFQKSDLTWFDVIRMMITTSTMNEDAAKEKKINYRDTDVSQSFDSLFYDREIVNEKATVAIVNAAGISGMGSRLEKLLSNLGVSVISVTTAQKPSNNSEIQFSDQSLYTLKKLHSLLELPMMETQDLTSSDILIIIGEDMKDTDLF